MAKIMLKLNTDFTKIMGELMNDLKTCLIFGCFMFLTTLVILGNMEPAFVISFAGSLVLLAYARKDKKRRDDV